MENRIVGGLASGSVAIAIAMLTRSFAGVTIIPELASQTLFALTPGQIESHHRSDPFLDPKGRYTVISTKLAGILCHNSNISSSILKGERNQDQLRI